MNEMFEYNPKSGEIINLKTNKIAGCILTSGYRQIKYKKKRYYGHRLAWYLYYGEWPQRDIDHINRDRSDNRIENLRMIDHRANCQNRISFKKGVSFHRHSNLWYSRIRINKTQKHLGYFKTKEEAEQAYLTALGELGEPNTFNYK